MGGWRLEVFRLGLYLGVPLAVLTASNMPSLVDRNQRAYRLDVYERTGVDMFPMDMESIEDVQKEADQRPYLLSLHRVHRQHPVRSSEITTKPDGKAA